MKKLTLVLSSLFFVLILGCSHENESEILGENSNKSLTNYDYDEALAYLESYFDGDFDLGASAETSDESYNYVVTEVILQGSSNVDGYLAIDRNLGTLLYFAHYKRDEDKIHSFDFIDNEDFILENTKDENGRSFMDIDLINNIPPDLEERRFWGWSCGGTYQLEPGGELYRTCCYYIIWLNNGCGEYLDSELPGSNPHIQ